MPCYHPMAGVRDGFTESGKPKYRIVAMSDHCLEDFPKQDVIQIPCGKCLGCRLQYAQDWQGRLLMELQCHDIAWFVTMMYDDEHVRTVIYEDDAGSQVRLETLCKKDVQDFMKRLRYHFPKDKLRFYFTGEYGDQTFRPHIHGIIYGLHLDDVEQIPGVYSVNHEPKFLSTVFDAIWGHGSCELGTVTPESTSYVARYVMKKVKKGWKTEKEALGLEPEFGLMSRKPAIGRPYFDQNPHMFDYVSCHLPTAKGSVNIFPTRYFRDLIDSPETKAQRYVSGKIKRETKLSMTDLNYLDQLKTEEKTKENQIAILKNREIKPNSYT